MNERQNGKTGRRHTSTQGLIARESSTLGDLHLEKDHSNLEQDHSKDWLLQALFCDESEAFRSPNEPGFGQWINVRLRVEKQLDAKAWLLVGRHGTRVPMKHCSTDGLFTWHEARLQCGLDPFSYRIIVECKDEPRNLVYQKDGAHWADERLIRQLVRLPTFSQILPALLLQRAGR